MFSYAIPLIRSIIYFLLSQPPTLRRGLGDFIIGCVFLMEVTNPFICMHFILKQVSTLHHTDNATVVSVQLKLTHTMMYFVNGFFLFVTYLLTRILSFPYVYYIYTQQYYHGNVMSALYSLRWCCHLGTGLGLLFQMFWFVRIVRLIVRRFYEIMLAKEKKH